MNTTSGSPAQDRFPLVGISRPSLPYLKWAAIFGLAGTCSIFMSLCLIMDAPMSRTAFALSLPAKGLWRILELSGLVSVYDLSALIIILPISYLMAGFLGALLCHGWYALKLPWDRAFIG